jgi:hypothetical protein
VAAMDAGKTSHQRWDLSKERRGPLLGWGLITQWGPEIVYPLRRVELFTISAAFLDGGPVGPELGGQR